MYQTIPRTPPPKTPHILPQLAQNLDVKAIFIKDENQRFGLSFKILGGLLPARVHGAAG
jgi:threonine dehydratase